QRRPEPERPERMEERRHDVPRKAPAPAELHAPGRLELLGADDLRPAELEPAFGARAPERARVAPCRDGAAQVVSTARAGDRCLADVTRLFTHAAPLLGSRPPPPLFRSDPMPFHQCVPFAALIALAAPCASAAPPAPRHIVLDGRTDDWAAVPVAVDDPAD